MMSCVPIEKLSAASATSENTGYPASNLLNGSQKEPFIAADGASTTVVTLTVNGGSNVVGLAGLDVVSLAFVVKDGDGNVVASGSVDCSGINNYYDWLTQTGTPRTEASFDYPLQMTPHTIEITSDSQDTANPPSIGVATCGIKLSHAVPRDLALDMQEVGDVRDRYHDGGDYYVPGTMLREWSMSGRYGLSPDFWRFIKNVVYVAQGNPIYWWATGNGNINDEMFARFDEYPSSQMQGDYAIASFKLLEVKG